MVIDTILVQEYNIVQLTLSYCVYRSICKFNNLMCLFLIADVRGFTNVLPFSVLRFQWTKPRYKYFNFKCATLFPYPHVNKPLPFKIEDVIFSGKHM